MCFIDSVVSAIVTISVGLQRCSDISSFHVQPVLLSMWSTMCVHHVLCVYAIVFVI